MSCGYLNPLQFLLRITWGGGLELLEKARDKKFILTLKGDQCYPPWLVPVPWGGVACASKMLHPRDNCGADPVLAKPGEEQNGLFPVGTGCHGWLHCIL